MQRRPVPGAELAAMVLTAADRFVAELADCPGEELAWRAAASGWSLGDVAEHVTIANQGVLRVLERSLVPLPGPPAIADDELPYLFYRGEEPPHVATPSGSWTDEAAATTAVRRSIEAVAAWAVGADDDLRAVGATHPAFGLLDGVQWVSFAAAHALRHRAQLQGLRSAYAAR